MFSSAKFIHRLVFAFLRRQRVVLCVAIAGLALSFLLFSVMRGWEHREMQAQVEGTARQRLELLRESLGVSLEALHALASLYRTGLPVDRERFRAFTASAFARRSELQALSWTPRIPVERRAEVEAAVRAEGFFQFQFMERDPDTLELIPATPRTDDYYPVIFIEPLQKNLPAFGHNANPRSSAAFLARDTGQVVSTSLIRLLQQENNEPGFIVYLPLYTGPTPTTVEERRRQFSGYLAAVFRIADLIDPALARIPGLAVEVRDSQPHSRSVAFKPPPADSSPPTHHLVPCTLPLAVADRQFQITFTPTTAFFAGRHPWQSWATLAGGILITCLATGSVHSSIRRNREIARANAALRSEIGERKRAEEAAATANRAKSEFITSLSHEIRTPLNSILGYTQILERDATLPENQRDAVTAIGSSGRHLLGLLNSILDLSRIEAGRIELQRDVFDIGALVQGLAEMFKPKCSEKGLLLRLDCHVPPDRGAVLGDEGKLRQVLINLLSNAIKFTSKGEVVLGVRHVSGDVWRFEVTDTGIGIAPAERASLFTRFHQTAAGRRLGGAGLGLAIARGHVELMGGHLEVQSERARGARFHFSLRLSTAVLKPGATPTYTLPRLAAGVRVRALVIDDNRDNRHILARLLRDIGCVVAEAGTDRDARDLARTSPPDVVLLDVFLAETTGPELLAAMRADGLPATTRVLLHTAAILSPEQHASLLATGADLLPKPFRLEDLCAHLRAVPGLRFDESAVAAASPPKVPMQFDPTLLPDELCERIANAAELHRTTLLKAGLQELRQLGGPAEALADHLRQLLRAYDLPAITRVMQELRARAALKPAETVP